MILISDYSKLPLVSIITPCFNEGKIVNRFLNSILNQTYKNIELIFVNDGSTDNTEFVVKSYEKRFIKEGIELIYIYQENKGLSSAINKGLSCFKGKYLCWPDSDDFLDEYSIEKRVEFLESNKDCAIVSNDANIYKNNNLDSPIGKISDRKYMWNNKNWDNKNHFKNLIEEKGMFCSGCHMIRSEAFLEVNPGRQIYNAKRGQNWQMLLPIYYKYKRGYISEPLYNYIIYRDSMSTGDNNIQNELKRVKEHETILKSTISKIDMPALEKEKYIKLIKYRYVRKRLYIYVNYGEKDSLIKEYNILKNNNMLNLRDRVKLLEGKHLFYRRIIFLLKAPFKIIRKIRGIK